METLLAKYGKITPLREEEEKSFKGLASTIREYEAGKTLVCGELDGPDQLFIVDEGELFASIELPSGARDNPPLFCWRHHRNGKHSVRTRNTHYYSERSVAYLYLSAKQIGRCVHANAPHRCDLLHIRCYGKCYSQ